MKKAILSTVALMGIASIPVAVFVFRCNLLTPGFVWFFIGWIFWCYCVSWQMLTHD